MADQAALIALLLDQEKANECIEEDRSLVMGQKWQEFSHAQLRTVVGLTGF